MSSIDKFNNDYMIINDDLKPGEIASIETIQRPWHFHCRVGITKQVAITCRDMDNVQLKDIFMAKVGHKILKSNPFGS